MQVGSKYFSFYKKNTKIKKRTKALILIVKIIIANLLQLTKALILIVIIIIANLFTT